MGVEIGLFPFSLITPYHASLPNAVVSASHCENVTRERKFSDVNRVSSTPCHCFTKNPKGNKIFKRGTKDNKTDHVKCVHHQLMYA